MLPISDRSSGAPRVGWAFAITFVAYLLAARLALLLTLPPGMASPLFPAAGIALVVALVWGRAMLPAVGLASMAANLWLVASTTGALGGVDVAVCAAIGGGAALQAGCGAALLRRHVAAPLLLAEPAQLLRFFALGALLACCISPSVGLAALWLAGRIGVEQALAHWAAWWVGDTIGVLIFAPLTLTLIGQPRAEWAPRRWPVALPLLLVTLLMGLGLREMMHLDAARQGQIFKREADSAAHAVRGRLMLPLHALEALRSLLSESATPDRDAFHRASAVWLRESGGLVALGWNERVARADVAAFEARERAGGAPDFRVFERHDAGSPHAGQGDAQVIRFIEPGPDNKAALGLNTESVALARTAIAQAVRSGDAVASASFELTQGGTGVVIYRAVYQGRPTTPEARVAALRGLVFATLRPDELLRSVATALPSPWQLCLLDQEAPAHARVLAGPPGCDRLPPRAPLQVAPLAPGARQWELRISAPTPLAPAVGSSIWPFALVGLLGTTMLGSLLLIVTGRARRIEAAVQQRTAELRQRGAELQVEVTEHQRTGAALLDSEQQLRNILDHVPTGIADTDGSGRLREANPRLREMLGLGDGPLFATHLADLLHPDDRASEAAARRQLLTPNTSLPRWRLRCLTADGRTLWVQVDVSVLHDTQGQVQHMVWVFEDITELLALEAAQQARRNAEAANRAKSEFLSRMSHELRTPLNAMLGFTQLLELDRKQPLAPHQKEWTGQIRHAGWHLLHMINDTLDLTRIESGHIDLESKALDLADLAAAAQALLSHQAEARKVRVEVRLDAQARTVMGDATRIKQILANLLSNAIKYNVEAGQVGVTSQATEAGMVAIEVSDTGSGMDATQLAQLFQPFNRLGRETGPIEGTGIGLVISRRLAELMGGRLLASSTPGRGSTFTLELPRAPMTSPPAKAGNDAFDLPKADYHQRLVHYVEDNETNVEVMRGIFALRSQIRLEVSMLGLDGLSAIRRRPPDLVLLDLHLPDIDGLELLRHLQADPELSHIPVIVVSADATEARIAQATAAGAARYLTKPVDVAQLLAILDEFLEQMETRF